jgi:hypothetical protein
MGGDGSWELGDGRVRSKEWKNPLPGAKSAGTGVSPSRAPFQDRGARRAGWVDLR